jgi:hypothetical protein
MGWWATSMARVVITAVVVKGRSKSEVDRDYGFNLAGLQYASTRCNSSGSKARVIVMGTSSL